MGNSRGRKLVTLIVSIAFMTLWCGLTFGLFGLPPILLGYPS